MVQISERTELAHDEPFFDGVQDAEVPELRHETYAKVTLCSPDDYLDIMVRYYQVADWTGEMLETDLRYLFKIDTMAKAAMTCSKRWAE